jgi:hypothetical protein
MEEPMKALARCGLAGMLALLLCAAPATAREAPPPFTQAELDQMLAPIALHPDSLLSQILMAATYPLEVVQAARWSRANPGLAGREAVNAVEAMDWDPSVKSLVAFPRILRMMDERLDWTQRVGEAFLAQQGHVMDTIQGLRRRAEAAGNLRSDERIHVTQHGDYIAIEPAQPHVVYVPYYDPLVVYGPWWWPAYPPVHWGPAPGYFVASPLWPVYYWSPAIAVSTGLFFGAFEWPYRRVTVVHVHHRPEVRVRQHVVQRTRVVWRHDPVHRRDVPYSHDPRPRGEPARPSTPRGAIAAAPARPAPVASGMPHPRPLAVQERRARPDAREPGSHGEQRVREGAVSRGASAAPRTSASTGRAAASGNRAQSPARPVPSRARPTVRRRRNDE